MKKLSYAMINALRLAMGEGRDGCIHTSEIHHSTLYALNSRGFITISLAGFGYKFGELYEITCSGRDALAEIERSKE